MGSPILHVQEITELGQRTYLVGEGEVAAVVDPVRGDGIVAVAEALGVRITHVIETHLHEDHLTGAIDTVERTGAQYVVPAGVGTSGLPVPAVDMADGESIQLGEVTLHAFATPGHAAHHLAWVVDGASGASAVLTGGSLAYGTVGRVDVAGEQLAEAARLQFRSVRRLAAMVPGSVDVWPGHVLPSFSVVDGVLHAGGARVVTSTLDEERRRNFAFTIGDEAAFVRRLQAAHGPLPPQYAETRAANRAGGAGVPDEPGAPTSLTDVWIRLADQEWVVDVRPRDQFAEAHFPGSVNVPLGELFSLTVPWLAGPDEPVTILAGSPGEAARAWDALAHVRVEPPVAWFEVDRSVLGDDARSTPVVGFSHLAERQRRGEAVTVLDVRWPDEWRGGHVPGAYLVSLPDLDDRIEGLPTQPIWVHCSTGYRAAVAASLLARRGRRAVIVEGDWATVGSRTLDVVLA